MEQAALNEVMQLLKAEPVDTTSLTNDDNIPSQREKLAILVSTGKSKEAIGVQLTHEPVKRLSDKDVQKYSKRYEAYIGNKTTDSLIDSALMLLTKGVGLVVSIDDVNELQKKKKKTQERLHYQPGAFTPCWRPCASMRQMAGTGQCCSYHHKAHQV